MDACLGGFGTNSSRWAETEALWPWDKKRNWKIFGLSQPFTSLVAEAWMHLESECRLAMHGWVAASEDLLAILPSTEALYRN